MDKKEFRNGCIVILFLLTLIWVCVLLDNHLKNKNKKNDEVVTTPIEEIRVVDSLLEENKRIDSSINVLDSIKNEEVQKIKNYNNDSTLELFKELVSD